MKEDGVMQKDDLNAKLLTMRVENLGWCERKMD